MRHVNAWVVLVDATTADYDHLVFYQVAGDSDAVNFVGIIDAEPLEGRETEDICVAEAVASIEIGTTVDKDIEGRVIAV